MFSQMQKRRSRKNNIAVVGDKASFKDEDILTFDEKNASSNEKIDKTEECNITKNKSSGKMIIPQSSKCNGNFI